MPSQNPCQPDDTLCHCSGTTLSEIQRLAAQGLDLDAISRKTGALSGCGGCEWDITELLEAAARRNPQG